MSEEKNETELTPEYLIAELQVERIYTLAGWLEKRLQIFCYSPHEGFVMQWNVSIAAMLTLPSPIIEIPVAPLRYFLTGHDGLPPEIEVDEAHAAEVSLRTPILVRDIVLMKKGGVIKWAGMFPIDGWHRVWKALAAGVDTLPAKVVTPKMEDYCLCLRGLQKPLTESDDVGTEAPAPGDRGEVRPE